MTTLDLIKNEFNKTDAFEEELKFISLFSLMNDVPIETIFKMPRARFEFIVNSLSEYNADKEREKNLINNISKSSDVLG